MSKQLDAARQIYVDFREDAKLAANGQVVATIVCDSRRLRWTVRREGDQMIFRR